MLRIADEIWKITLSSENSTCTSSPDEGHLSGLHCKPDKIRYTQMVNKLVLVKKLNA